MAAPWSEQDKVFYQGKLPKGHVQMLVRKLNQMAATGEWIWPEETEKGYEVAAKYLADYLGIKYAKDDLKECVEMLLQRNAVFSRLLASSGISWDSTENRFEVTDEKVWDKLLKVDARFGWYRNYGEPFWSELGCIFDGWSYWFKMANAAEEGSEKDELDDDEVDDDEVDDDSGTFTIKMTFATEDADKAAEEERGGANAKDETGETSTPQEFGSRNSAFEKVTLKFGKK